MPDEIVAAFDSPRTADAARDWLIEVGVAPSDISASPYATDLIRETHREARVMSRIVLVIVGWSIIGTAVGAAIGALLSITVGPDGTSGLIIQMVSWAIFAHLLIGMVAGYLLLADRSERELGRERPVLLIVRATNINASTVADQLRGLGATRIETKITATR